MNDSVSSRRRFVVEAAVLAAGSALPGHALAQSEAPKAAMPPPAVADATNLVLRAIPRSGERIAPVGLGTAVVFNVGEDRARRAQLAQVIDALIAGGGKLVDTASTYGRAEEVLGEVVGARNLRARVFLATKLESPDAAELARSLELLRTDSVDLLQLHNVRSGKQSLAAFRDWKARGRCRYVGITSTYHGDFAAVEEVLRRERPEFLQVDYSLDNRIAEERLLPAAQEHGAAVLTALPFGRNRLFRATRDKPLPDFAREIAVTSWAQFFLKFLLGDPRVTAVIPGTADPAHMTDNLGAARGPMPDASLRARMIKYVESL
jgi:aryl-alcohol dehydrogenase-like predicted oxidoreductase